MAVGGPFKFLEKEFLPQIFFNKFLYYIISFGFIKLVFPRYPTLPNANMAVRKEAYQKIGGFNPQLEWGQEVDLCKRLKGLGKIVFSKDVLVLTSFRRFSDENKKGLPALWHSLKEVNIGIRQGLVMHIHNKTFSAQREIRKKLI